MAEAFTVNLLPEAQRQLERLPKAVQANLLTRITALSVNPRPRMSKPLRGTRGVWRLRVGDYRVIYSIDDAARQVLVTQIGNRRDVYRGL